MVYADEILDYSGQRKTGVTAGGYGPSADVSPEAGGTITVPQLTVNENGLITGAVERTVTLPSGGGGGGGSEWVWNSAPAWTSTLENAWHDDDDDPTGYDIPVETFSDSPKAAMLVLNNAAVAAASSPVSISFFLSNNKYYVLNLSQAVDASNRGRFVALFAPDHGVYVARGNVGTGAGGNGNTPAMGFFPGASPIDINFATNGLSVTGINIGGMPIIAAGTTISVYVPATA